MDNSIFKRDPDEYKLTLHPTKNYFKQMSKFVKGMTGSSDKDADILTNEIIQSKKIKNPLVTYRFRDDNGDRTFKDDTLTNYIKDTIDNNEILTPTFTTLDHPSKNRSLHADFLNINVDKRKIDKKLAFKFKQLGDPVKYLYHNTLQKVRKTFNNSLSGAYASMSTMLYYPAGHSILTSMTRSVASIGNAVSESFISGNKHFKNPDVTFNYIVSIVTEVKMSGMRYIIHKYKLHTPTVDEVMDMILFSSSNYWTDTVKEQHILNYLNKLTGEELAAVLYVNDFYHLKKYNEEFVKSMLHGISRRCETGSVDHLKDIDKASDGVMNLVHHICMNDIKNMDVNYKELAGTNTLQILASTTANVTKELAKYKALIRILYTTNILPINIASVKEMLRDSIVLSDTDSTCGAYDTWVDWYFGNIRYSAKAVGLAATVMTINTQIIDHNIKIFAKNMNIMDKLMDLLKMKNEYFWSSFTTPNISKHYFADTIIQEGNVFDKSALELKGVHLISSAGNMAIAEEASKLMSSINESARNGLDIDPHELLTNVADMERDLIKRIKKGDITIFKRGKINSPDSYKHDDKSRTPYFYHMLWESAFADTYGTPGNPEYGVIKIPTTISNKVTLNKFIDGVEDNQIRNGLTNTLSKYNKTALGVILIPVSVIVGSGIPKELLTVVDSRRMVTDSLNVMYLILETLGIFKKEGLMVCETGY